MTESAYLSVSGNSTMSASRELDIEALIVLL